MIPTTHERLQELHEKMLDWICEHIKDDEDLFHALYGRIGFAQSELDPEIECRLYKMYNALPPKEKLQSYNLRHLIGWRLLIGFLLILEMDAR